MSKLENIVRGQEEDPLLKSLIEGGELEKWQKHFCDIANVFAWCVDDEGTPLVKSDREKEEAGRIKRLIDENQLLDMLSRLSESVLEDQTVETTAYPNMRLAVIVSRANGKPVVSWLVCGILSDAENMQDYENPPLEGFENQITEKQFLRAVDTLRDITSSLFEYKLSVLTANAEYARARRMESEMEENLKRAEALTEAVWILDGDEGVEQKAGKLLEIAGSVLDLSVAVIYRVQKGMPFPEIGTKWCRKDVEWEPDAEGMGLSLLRGEKTLILSQSSSIGVSEKEGMENLGFRALVVMPVSIPGVKGIHVCFGETLRERVWKLEEIRFLRDCVKILQRVLSK
ncbi:MAG: GAF domain-containing protein [Lachnospiraceae bacterium]|nr:GAF domain-containing protein [Lachnospiraceae bacterium]MDE6962891.1 GAF domain-containing protein [Lachnospiraceae bacterium]